MGGLYIRPIGSKTLYQLRRASRTPELQALLPGRYMEPVHPTPYMQSIRGREQEASNICPCITKRPYLKPPQANIKDVYV